MSKFNQNLKLHIGLYQNTTRVRADKIPGLVGYVNDNASDIVVASKFNLPHFVPFDNYSKFLQAFSNFDRRNDDKYAAYLILYKNHTPFALLRRRPICPDCGEETSKLPFYDHAHKDIYECSCGEMFHESRVPERRHT